MLTEEYIPKALVNPIQESPLRSSIYSIYRCEDQVIGFEFVKESLTPSYNRICNTIAVSLCIPVEVLNPLTFVSAEFHATDDPCLKGWIINKVETPSVELQLDDDDHVIGILVRFFKQESCCYPPQMAFRLSAIDESGCKYSLSTGLLVFK